MIISAKVIKNPRVKRRCERCLEFIEGSQLRLYGAAHDGEPLYVIFVHPSYDCMGYPVSYGDRKIEKAMELAGII